MWPSWGRFNHVFSPDASILRQLADKVRVKAGFVVRVLVLEGLMPASWLVSRAYTELE
jgi:hypothetical protein